MQPWLGKPFPKVDSTRLCTPSLLLLYCLSFEVENCLYRGAVPQNFRDVFPVASSSEAFGRRRIYLTYFSLAFTYPCTCGIFVVAGWLHPNLDALLPLCRLSSECRLPRGYAQKRCRGSNVQPHQTADLCRSSANTLRHKPGWSALTTNSLVTDGFIIRQGFSPFTATAVRSANSCGCLGSRACEGGNFLPPQFATGMLYVHPER